MSIGDSSLESTIAEIILDPRVRDIVGIYLEGWMFTKRVYEDLANALLSKDFRSRTVDKKILQLYMQSNHPDMLSSDWTYMEGVIDRYSPVNDNDLDAVINIVSNFIKARLHEKGIDLYTKGQKVEAEPYFIKSTTFRIQSNPFINPMEVGILAKLKAKDMPVGGKVIKSSLGIVNTTTLWKGYKNGDLVAVCMRPKGGKTTLMIQEGAAALAQGFKVCHMHFGDYTEFDSLTKYMACICNAPIHEVVHNEEHYKRETEKRVDLNNLRVASFPALSVDCFEAVSHMRQLRRDFPFDMTVLDYDANISVPMHDSDSMYQSGGLMYATFKGAGQDDGHVTLIGSQPKTQFWKDEIMPMEAPNESSKKQFHIDILINGGRNLDCNRIGTFSLPLVRRGVSGEFARASFDDIRSRIEDITSDDYERTLRDYKARKQDTQQDTVLEGVKFEDKRR